MNSLNIAGKAYSSRLLVGTGKYKDFAETKAAIEASGAEIVTVAIRRTNIGQHANEPSILEAIPPSRYTILPNTAGCYSADDAVRTLRLARELLDGHDLVKLEVLGDPQTLYPNMPETLTAAQQLVKEDFKVMVYCSDDPILAKQLEEIGCVAVMPLASLIGSGHGHFESVEFADHYRQCQGAGVGRCGCRHSVRCGHRDGVRLRWRVDEYRHRRRERSGVDGERDEKSSRGGAGSVSCGAHAEEVVQRESQFADRRRDRRIKKIRGVVLPDEPESSTGAACSRTGLRPIVRSAALCCVRAAFPPRSSALTSSSFRCLAYRIAKGLLT